MFANHDLPPIGYLFLFVLMLAAVRVNCVRYLACVYIAIKHFRSPRARRSHILGISKKHIMYVCDCVMMLRTARCLQIRSIRCIGRMAYQMWRQGRAKSYDALRGDDDFVTSLIVRAKSVKFARWDPGHFQSRRRS